MACSLCDLPTPTDPLTADDVAGQYCCRGCLAVARRLDDVAETEPEAAAAVATGDPTAAGEETFLTVEGMHCSTCETFLEAVATDHPAVANAQASYPAGTVRLVHDGSVEPDGLASALEGTGYAVRPMAAGAPDADGPAARLLVGGFFGMMTMLWYVLFLYPAYLGLPGDLLLLDVHGDAGRYVLANTWVMATVVLGYTGYPVLRGAVVSLRAGQPNMDLLVALAAVTAYTYSAIALVLGAVEVYFDITVAVVLVVTLGQYYKGRITDRAASVLESVTRERVSEARRRTGASTESVPVADLAAGDEVVIRAGERVPLDGTVVEGRATVDESLITGESLPEPRTPGETVVGGAEVSAGALVVAIDDGGQSTLDRVVRRLWTIQTATPGVQRLADRIAVVFVPLVVLLALGATVVHGVLGASGVGAMLTGLTVLIVACPCALGLATPLSVATATRAALADGIAVLDESVFERASAIDVVAFDKTGTLTTGEMRVHEVVIPGGDGDDPEERAAILERAAALETFADHPVADAITAAAPAGEHVVTDLDVRPGAGVLGDVSGEHTVVGTIDLLQEAGLDVPPAVARTARSARAAGTIPVCVGWDGTARGVIRAGDEPRANWESALRTLGDGRRIVVITGDGDAAADRLRATDAVDEVFAEVPPEGKAAVVSELGAEDTVAMVGDGTNDAPALAAADLGIALSSGTALAADAADVVITSPDIGRVADVFGLTRAARRRIRQNLGWAFCYNGIAVPLALLGALNPLLAAGAMTTSSLLVVLNSARSL